MIHAYKTSVGKDATKKLFFSAGIKKVVKPWSPCVEVYGDYVEK
jgi:hypothetical protein